MIDVEKTLLGYKLTWKDLGVLIIANRLKYKQDALRGEVTVKVNLPGYAPHLHQAMFNFSSTRSKADLVKALEKQCNEINWDAVIEQLRVYIHRLYKQGEPVVEIRHNSETVVDPPSFLLYPLLPKKQLSLFFGEGGVGKSTLCLLLCTLAQRNGNNFGLTTQNKISNILYLDYETDRATIEWQFNCLLRGLDAPESRIYYRKCTLPFTEDIESLKEIVSEINAELVIVDSVGTACAENLNDAHTANQLAMAVRSLDTTTLLISHTSKEKTNNKTPYGSIYFWNNARNIWEIKKVQESDNDDYVVGLFHRKSNISKLHSAIGFRFTYNHNVIKVTPENLLEIEDFVQDIPLKERILTLLKREGLLDTTEIARRLNADKTQVTVRLSEMKKKGIVVKIDNKYGVASKEAV